MSNEKTARFFEEMASKKVAFIGVGVTHTNLIKLFCKKGIPVTVCDKRSAQQMGAVYEELKGLGVRFLLGET